MGFCYCSAIYAEDPRRGYRRSSCRSHDPERDGTTGTACIICRFSEVFAFHQVVKWALAPAHPVTFLFDCAGADKFAAGLAIPSSDTRIIATARRVLVHYAESHGVHIKFTHVHSHQGHGLGDNMAKAGAEFLTGNRYGRVGLGGCT